MVRHQPGCKALATPFDVINNAINYKSFKTPNEKPPIVLSEEKMLAYFKKHDVNKDGKLSWDELKKAFSGLGVTWVRWTADRALRKADDDEDGCISLSEKEMDKLIEFVIKRKLNIQ
ncbi:putative calcium-binding protein CML15 [Artemisia annua]|uniref:Putative calcium-binding protein CML15 n=1 Tax=Artemisia annua TaxID=35608 RepID=A0A2U1KZL2_ARTAN|nr:putative calcium-binding protein CML15 [Artemisia annua]